MIAGPPHEYLSMEPMAPRKGRAAREWAVEFHLRAIALLLLILFAPFLFGVFVAIWLIDGGPVLFGHYRVGRHGKLFRCWKFRTMARDADERLERLLASDPIARGEWEQWRKLSSDPRVTRLGSFLRKSSLDELPQLFNVLCGQMVFVGPRPITCQELHKYGNDRWYYLSVIPGITGLWQVSGRNQLSYAERIQMDREYVESRSLLIDLHILSRTVGVVLRRDGVY